LNSPDTRTRVTDLLPDSVRQDDEPVFEQPWQAQAFAMAVELIQAGRFQWTEWADTLGEEIANARANGFADDGSDYYALWLRALERLVTEKKLAQPQELDELQAAWHQAYSHTPHGQAVVLTGPTGLKWST
jgi:nitrile hydratase accessory protein